VREDRGNEEGSRQGLPEDAANRYENEPEEVGSNHPSWLIIVGLDVDKALFYYYCDNIRYDTVHTLCTSLS
jgi:hypothetical protein